MSMPTTQTLRLGDVLGRLATRRWWVALGLAVGLILGGAAGILMPRAYTSTAQLQVAPITTTPFSSTPASQQVSIETERNIMSSPEIAQSVIDELGLDLGPRELLERVTVASPQGSLVLRVSFTDADPQVASDVANAFAEEYLQARTARARAISAELQDNLEEQIESLTDASAAGDNATVQQQILELRQEQQRLVAVGVDTGNIFGVAAPSSAPSSLSTTVYLGAGAALGLLLGTVVALVAELMDPRARRPARVAGATGWDVITASTPTDGEALLTLVGRLGRRLDAARDTGRAAVLLLVPTDKDLPAISPGVSDYLDRTGHPATLVALGPGDEDTIDRGYPSEDDTGATEGVLLLDAGRVASPARRSSLAGRADAVVLVAHARTRLATLRSWSETDELQDLPVLVWYQRGRTRRNASDPGTGRTRRTT